MNDRHHAAEGSDVLTDRTIERQREDEQFVPVIVKRTDEARRHPDDTLERAVTEGLEQLNRMSMSLLLSALAAGLIVGFSAMAAAVTAGLAADWQVPGAQRIATALVYPLGFIMCVLSGTQLFTEHTATAVYPVLDGRSPFWRLLRLWGIVVAGNLLGGACMAWLLAVSEPVIHAAHGYHLLATHAIETSLVPLFGSTILAGWLMALGAWLVLGTSNTDGQILSIYIVTFLIGLGGLHHSIAGSVEVMAAWLTGGSIPAVGIARFVAVALTGNLIGGSMFVGVLNYTHIRGTQSEPHPAPEQ